VLCDLCGATTEAGTEEYATVPDSSAVDRCTTHSDGYRRLVACGPAHRDILVRGYLHRPYDEEELWARTLLRAVRLAPYENHDIDDLALMTGLTPVQIMRAQRWQSVWLDWRDPALDA
jgi:hypothetical protein